jgi:hypothetical protein
VLVAGGQFNQFTQMPREQIKGLFEAMRDEGGG